MSLTPQDVMAKLSTAQSALAKTTKSYPQMVKTYGSDWHKWPANGNWSIALSNLEAAKVEAGQLVAPAPPTAAFTFEEV